MDYELIVIGAGPGGCSAALYGAREGLTTLLVEPAAPGGQMSVTAWVENYPGVPGASGQDLANAMLAGAKAAGATFLQAQVTGLHLTGSPKIVETTRGAYTAGAVVLAMGAAPRKLALPEAERFLGRGLSYCATCDGMFFRNKDVAVLGGGNGAAASARSQARLCRQVHVIFRKEHMSAEAREQEALAACPNVILHPGTLLAGLSGGEQLEALALEDRATGRWQELPCQGLFAAIGRIPETVLLQGQVKLDSQGYVLAGESTQTNLPGVYAAGDIRTKPLRQIVTAAADGATAAHLAAQYLSSFASQET